jgi:hypothetical protein
MLLKKPNQEKNCEFQDLIKLPEEEGNRLRILLLEAIEISRFNKIFKLEHERRCIN